VNGNFADSCALKRLADVCRGEIDAVAGDSRDRAREALIKMEVACRLALESLANLPTQTEQALRDPIEQLCRVTEHELQQLQPGFTRGDRVA
jgi:hypothetical protein